VRPGIPEHARLVVARVDRDGFHEAATALRPNRDMNRYDQEIRWNLSGEAVEAASFRQIEQEVDSSRFAPGEWRVVRRLIHTTGDPGIASHIRFCNDPIEAGLAATRDLCPIYCDSNMIRSGLSLARLRRANPSYSRESIHCYIADPDVGAAARERGITRALVSVEKARAVIDGAVVLIGNAPLALAGICRMVEAGEVRPRLVIGMPVGFVNVLEAKRWLEALSVPHIVIQVRRGGSPLAVAALHGILESLDDEAR